MFKTAFAPASVANFVVGFDLLGFAIEGLGDTVRVTRTKEPGVKIKSIEVAEGLETASFRELPKDASKNTAAAGLLQLIEEQKLNFGFEIEIQKGIPLGSGLGGSAASPAAAITAANALLDRPVSKADLLKYAITGEEAASGARHGDNVIPSLFGGFLIVAAEENIFTALPVAADLRAVVLYPGFRLDTRVARQVLPKNITLKTHTRAQTRLAMVVAAMMNKDYDKLKKFMIDEIVEPVRAPLIPGFYDIKNAALDSGAIACSISGAGPSLFALVEEKLSDRVAEAMLKAAKSHHKAARFWNCKISSGGARLIP
jgi:homoserine kinase